MMKFRLIHNCSLLCLKTIFMVLCIVVAPEALGQTVPGPKMLIKKADKCRKSLYQSEQKKRYRHNWLSCIQNYENITLRYPKSDEAAWSLYRSGQMYTELYKYSGIDSDLDEAIKHYERLVKEYKDHRLADDSQYRIGEIYYRYKKDPAQAYVEFLKVEVKFPSGDMRPKARSMLDKLAVIVGKKGSKKEAETLPQQKLTTVKNIRHWSTPNYTRVVIDLAGPVKYVSSLLKEDPSQKKPRRLYIDLQKTHVGANMESPITIKGGLLQSARAAQYDSETVRVVLDINSIGSYKIFPLYDPFRIVVDVRGTEGKNDESKVVSTVKRRPVRKGIRKVKKPDETVSLARQLGLGVKRIVIDPGHGGKDPGCYLKGGIEEKNIVLTLAKILSRKIMQRLKCEVILTRKKDVFLSLEQRTAFANMKKADLFISLHVNAHEEKNVHGLETYFLNMATDQRSVMLAARENATSEKNISDLQSILNDLMLNTKISESSRLAYDVQNGMVYRIEKQYKSVKNLGVKQAPFYVLIGAEMPAVLVETGFITNPTEEQRLLSQRYLDILADGIVGGIESYIKGIDKSYKGG